MIPVQKLINAIASKVAIWEFQDIYSTREGAIKAAARMCAETKGVKVKKTGELSYIVQYWR